MTSDEGLKPEGAPERSPQAGVGAPSGVGNWFREMCDEAELTGFSAHGLREAGCRRLAWIIALVELTAIRGWTPNITSA
jgi:hypothetical protein